MYSPEQPRDPKTGKWSSGLHAQLETQLLLKGHDAEKAHALAVEIMTNQGTFDPKTGELTAKGREREAMGKKARVIDRAARQLGREPEEIGLVNRRPYVKTWRAPK